MRNGNSHFKPLILIVGGSAYLTGHNVSLKIEAHGYASTIFRCCAMPNALCVLLQATHIRVTVRLDAGLGLPFCETIGAGYWGAWVRRRVRGIYCRGVSLRV